MRIRARASRRGSSRIVLNLAGMIDVTFLLLIYFMVTVIVAMDEDRLSPALRTEEDPASGAASDFQPQLVEVLVMAGEPTYRVGRRTCVDREGLTAILRDLPTSVGVIVRVSGGVPVGFAVSALQSAHDAGFEQVTYVPAE